MCCCESLASMISTHILTIDQSIVGSDVWLDPTEEEARAAQGTVVVSCMPALGTVTSVRLSGQMKVEEVLTVSQLFISPNVLANSIPSVHGCLPAAVYRHSCCCSTIPHRKPCKLTIMTKPLVAYAYSDTSNVSQVGQWVSACHIP